MNPIDHNYILVADDDQMSRDMLADRLRYQGYKVVVAENGRIALDMLQKTAVDLVLLDIMMPYMDGVEMLSQMKQNMHLRDIPVIVMSALEDNDTIVQCLRLGAADYFVKPGNPRLLKARVEGCLERKRWQDLEKAYLAQIEQEQLRAETLLLNVLPDPIAERLKYGKEQVVNYFQNATVLFADIVDFTQLSAQLQPKELVETLNRIFSDFDELVGELDLEKIKTIGDAYMVVGGVPEERKDHVTAVANLALAMQTTIHRHIAPNHQPYQLRIGINTGPVIAGVIGTKKFSYDLWGDTVNIAHRMQTTSLPGLIQITAETAQHLNQTFSLQTRAPIEIKGKGFMQTYFLENKKPS